jgi:hypothetical protein
MPEIEMDWWKKSKTDDLPKRTAEPITGEPITGKTRWLKTELADFVTHTSSAANVVIDGASAELTKRITRQLAEIERARAEGRPLPNILE